MRSFIIVIATGLGTGYVPFAPGTAGSVVGIALSWLVFGGLWKLSPWIALGLFAIAFAASCWIAGRAEQIFAQHDSSKIVIDEVLGMVFTMFGNPLTPLWFAIGFVLFRAADVIKPFPAAWIDRNMRNGAGVMLDDLAAAVYANVLLQVLSLVLRR